MARTTVTARLVGLGTVAILAAAMSACGSGGTAASPSERTSTTPATTVASTPTATPDPAPALTADEALHAYLADQRLFLEGAYTATYLSGTVAGELSGTYIARGDDFSISTTNNTVPGWAERVDQLFVGGNGYQRVDEGRWYATENIYLVSGLASIIDDASWDNASRPGWLAPDEIDMLAFASALGALPANLTMEGTEQVEGEVLAQIQPTGELTAMDIVLAITSTLPGVAEEQTEWSLAFTFEPGSTPTRIEAPQGAWRREFLPKSSALVELPSAFERQEVEGGAGEMYLGPNAEGIYVTVGPAGNLPAAQNYAELVTFFTSDPVNGWVGPPELDEELKVGGDTAVVEVGVDSEAAAREPTVGRLIAAHSTLEDVEFYLAKAILQVGDKVYVLHWMGLADGTEVDQLALFKEIASTFTPLT